MSDPKTVVSRSQVDAAIAEHVFGWKRFEGEEANLAADPELRKVREGQRHTKCTWMLEGRRMACLECGSMPQFSIDMAKAWDVVEELRLRWTEATEKSNGVDNDFAHPFDDEVFFESIRSDAQRRWPWTFLYATPMNICIAALESLGIEVSE